MTLEAFVKKTGQTLKDNSPAILTALGVAGVASTGYLASKAAYRAGQFVVIENQTRAGTDEEELTAKEIVAVTWRSFAPVVLTAGFTAACVIAAHTVSTRRNAALMSAVTLGETAFREYRDKMVEIAGKAKDQKAVDAIAQDKVTNASGSEVIFVGDDKVLCFDTLTGRFFESTRSDIEKAEITINRQILGDMYASQNEWYDRIGLARISDGDDRGWNNDTPLEVMFSAVLEDDKPVMALSYRFLPKIGYHKIW